MQSPILFIQSLQHPIIPNFFRIPFDPIITQLYCQRCIQFFWWIPNNFFERCRVLIFVFRERRNILECSLQMRIRPLSKIFMQIRGKKNKLTLFSSARDLMTVSQPTGCCTVNTLEPGLIIPLFCHAIASMVFPNSWVCSSPSDVIPTVFVFLQTKRSTKNENTTNRFTNSNWVTKYAKWFCSRTWHSQTLRFRSAPSEKLE